MKLEGWIAYWEDCEDWMADADEGNLDAKIREVIDDDSILPIKRHMTIDIPDVVATGKVTKEE